MVWKTRGHLDAADSFQLVYFLVCGGEDVSLMTLGNHSGGLSVQQKGYLEGRSALILISADKTNQIKPSISQTANGPQVEPDRRTVMLHEYGIRPHGPYI